MLSENQKAHAAAWLGNFFFGAGVVAVKMITPTPMLPLAVNVSRIIVGVTLLWMVYIFSKNKQPIQKKDIPLFIACSITGIVINQIFFVKGSALTSPIHTALLGLSSPICIIIISSIFYKEKIKLLTLIGISLAITGSVILILLKDTGTPIKSSLLGDMFILINACSYAVYLVIVKPLMQTYNAISVLRIIFTIGALFIIPIGIKDFSMVQWHTINSTQLAAILFVLFGATFLSYVCTIYAIKTLGSQIVGSYIYTQPIFTAIAAIVILNDKISIDKIAAAALIFFGVYLVSKRKTV